jgi:hypothetical protein
MAAKKKTVTKKRAPAKKQPVKKEYVKTSRPAFSVTQSFSTEDEIRVRKFLGIQNVLSGGMGCITPPYNPYQLISYRNGYHWRCIDALRDAIAVQGWDADAELKEHIEQPNPDYSMTELLRLTVDDLLIHGWFTTNVLVGEETANIWHSPSLKTRVKFDIKKKETSYVRFEYEAGAGVMAFIEEPEFTGEEANGVSMCRGLSRTANKFYGEPHYFSITDLLEMSSSIVYAAKRWFDHGLMADTAIIEKGMGREDEEIDALKTYLSENLKGVKNSHKILYLQVAPDEDIRFDKLNSDYPAKETTELRKSSREEIIIAHGMTQRSVGISEAGSLGGISEGQVQFGIAKILTINPWQIVVENYYRALFRKLGFPQPDSFRLKALNIATDSDTMTTLATGVNSGIIPATVATQEWMTEKSNVSKFIRELQMIRAEMMKGELV